MTMMARMTRMTTIEVQFLRHNSTIILFFDRMKYSSSLTRKRGRDWTLNDHNNHEDQGRTGVFPWCMIGWFYFPWNLNLINYSSWFVIWRFCVTREELELLTDVRDFTTLFGVILSSLHSKRFQSSYWAKVRAEAKKGWRGRGRGEEETLACKPHDSGKRPLIFHGSVHL